MQRPAACCQPAARSGVAPWQAHPPFHWQQNPGRRDEHSNGIPTELAASSPAVRPHGWRGHVGEGTRHEAREATRVRPWAALAGRGAAAEGGEGCGAPAFKLLGAVIEDEERRYSGNGSNTISS
eukprot:646273-Rhodomonas_salina.1